MTPGKQCIFFIQRPGRAQKDRHTRLKGLQGCSPLSLRTYPTLCDTLKTLGFLSVYNQEAVSESVCWVGQIQSSDPKVHSHVAYTRRSFTLKRGFPSSHWTHRCKCTAATTILCVTKINSPNVLASSYEVGAAFPSPAACLPCPTAARNHLSLWWAYNAQTLHCCLCFPLTVRNTFALIYLEWIWPHYCCIIVIFCSLLFCPTVISKWWTPNVQQNYYSFMHDLDFRPLNVILRSVQFLLASSLLFSTKSASQHLGISKLVWY